MFMKKTVNEEHYLNIPNVRTHIAMDVVRISCPNDITAHNLLSAAPAAREYSYMAAFPHHRAKMCFKGCGTVDNARCCDFSADAGRECLGGEFAEEGEYGISDLA